jgi:chromosome segregation ATPase
MELSLNLPPDFDQFDGGKGSHLKKMKQVIKLLTEKQTQSLRTLEEKTEKLKEMKKANKELTRELETLRADQRIHKGEEGKLDSQIRKLKEELEKVRVERDRGVEAQAKLQKKVEKLERKIKDLRDSEQRIQSLEKQKELIMTVNNQKQAEIQSLLNELNDKQDALNHAVSRSQINVDASVYDDSAAGLRARYLKLKRLFLGLRDAYLQLQDDFANVSAALDKEVKLRESILEDFLKRSDFFEQKISEFRDFHDRIIDVKGLIISKKLDH